MAQQTNSSHPSWSGRARAAYIAADSAQPHQRLWHDCRTQVPELKRSKGLHVRQSVDFMPSLGPFRWSFCLQRQALFPRATAETGPGGAGITLPRDARPGVGKALPPAPGRGRSGARHPSEGSQRLAWKGTRSGSWQSAGKRPWKPLRSNRPK